MYTTSSPHCSLCSLIYCGFFINHRCLAMVIRTSLSRSGKPCLCTVTTRIQFRVNRVQLMQRVSPWNNGGIFWLGLRKNWPHYFSDSLSSKNITKISQHKILTNRTVLSWEYIRMNGLRRLPRNISRQVSSSFMLWSYPKSISSLQGMSHVNIGILDVECDIRQRQRDHHAKRILRPTFVVELLGARS